QTSMTFFCHNATRTICLVLYLKVQNASPPPFSFEHSEGPSVGGGSTPSTSFQYCLAAARQKLSQSLSQPEQSPCPSLVSIWHWIVLAGTESSPVPASR